MQSNYDLIYNQSNQNPLEYYQPLYQIPFIENQQDQNLQQDFYPKKTKDMPTLFTNTTKSTLTNIQKGRPKKKIIDQTTILQKDEPIFCQHHETISALILSYVFRSLKNQKQNRYGFLQMKLCPSNYYYQNVQSVLKKNKLLSNLDRKYLRNQIYSNKQLNFFIQKILWMGAHLIIDQLIVIIVEFLQKNIQFLDKMGERQGMSYYDIQQFKKVGRIFTQNALDIYWNKFNFINLKSSKLQRQQLDQQCIKRNFYQFVEIFVVTLALIYTNVQNNPYYSRYLSQDFTQQQKKQKKLWKDQQQEKKQMRSQMKQFMKILKSKKIIKKQKKMKKNLSQKQKEVIQQPKLVQAAQIRERWEQSEKQDIQLVNSEDQQFQAPQIPSRKLRNRLYFV